jgi:hypothetical protein
MAYNLIYRNDTALIILTRDLETSHVRFSRLLAEAVTNLVLPLTQSIYLIFGSSVVLHRHLVEPVQFQSQTETPQTIEGICVRILG